MVQNGDALFNMKHDLETRWASPENPSGTKGGGGKALGGRKGLPSFPLEPGECRVLAEEPAASGTIRRIWITINNRSKLFLRGLKLSFYWDQHEQPAVSVPLGDFFGQGLGRMATFESALFTSPEGRSFNCCIPMPFRTGMKVTVTNESPERLDLFFYDIDYTIGDRHDEDMLYFHAFYNREKPTQMLRDFEILPRVTGQGRFLGCNIGVVASTGLYSTSWWGEGEVKVYLDGDREWPTLCGTGTEDYIGTGWGQGRYDHLYQGCSLADHEAMQFCFYRYHILDPIYFHQDIRVTIQQIGCWDPPTRANLHELGTPIRSTAGEPVDFAPEVALAPYGLYERHDDWSACAYFYFDKPTHELAELAPVVDRIG